MICIVRSRLVLASATSASPVAPVALRSLPYFICQRKCLKPPSAMLLTAKKIQEQNEFDLFSTGRFVGNSVSFESL